MNTSVYTVPLADTMAEFNNSSKIFRNMSTSAPQWFNDGHISRHHLHIT